MGHNEVKVWRKITYKVYLLFVMRYLADCFWTFIASSFLLGNFPSSMKSLMSLIHDRGISSTWEHKTSGIVVGTVCISTVRFSSFSYLPKATLARRSACVFWVWLIHLILKKENLEASTKRIYFAKLSKLILNLPMIYFTTTQESARAFKELIQTPLAHSSPLMRASYLDLLFVRVIVILILCYVRSVM